MMAASMATRGVFGYIHSCLVLALLAGCAPTADMPCGADCLARYLVERIPAGEGVALRPLGPPETGIPEGVAEDIQDNIQRALESASDGQHRFVSRVLFNEKWRTRNEQGGDFEEFMEGQRVDVAISCKDKEPRRAEAEVRLSCTAYPAGEGGRLDGDVIAPGAEFPVNENEWPFFRYDYTVSRLAYSLSALAAKESASAPGRLVGAFVAERTSGQPSALSADIEDRAQAIVENQLAARRRNHRRLAETDAALTGAAAAESAGAWELRGEIAWADESRATVRLRLREAGENGRSVAKEANIDRAWLPPNLSADPGPRRHRAAGSAVESAGFGAAAAQRAALNLARARLVARALGRAAPDIDAARSEVDGVAALSWLEWGVPEDERITDGPWESRPGVWKVELEARVVAVGSAVRPRFEAELEKDEFRAGERLRVELTAGERVHAAAFAWDADGTVWRLFPNFVDREAAIPAGRHVDVPHPVSCEVIVKPLPGARSSWGAVVAVASAVQLAFEDLAPPACYDSAAPAPVAVPAGDFLAALAGLGLGLERAKIVVLPYRMVE